MGPSLAARIRRRWRSHAAAHAMSNRHGIRCEITHEKHCRRVERWVSAVCTASALELDCEYPLAIIVLSSAPTSVDLAAALTPHSPPTRRRRISSHACRTTARESSELCVAAQSSSPNSNASNRSNRIPGATSNCKVVVKSGCVDVLHRQFLACGVVGCV